MMVEDIIKIVLRDNLNHENYQKLITFFNSGDAKYGNEKLFRVLQARVFGTSPTYSNVIIGLYNNSLLNGEMRERFKERKKEVMKNLVDFLSELEVL